MAKDSIERGKERTTAFRPARRQPAAPPEPSQSPPLLFPSTSAGNSFPTCSQEAWLATLGKERQSHFRPSEPRRRAPSTDSRARCSRFPPSPFRERHGSPQASGREKFAAPGRPARVSEGKQAARPSDQPLSSLLLARKAALNLRMSSVKHLVYAIIHFLREQSQMDTFTSDEQESLEVAIQCLETVFKINLEDTRLAVPSRLIEIFADSCHKNEILPLSDSLPEDLEKADQLKDEGNNHMKEDNYAAAVDCYTRAIELDPNNAVYYCNRAAAQSKLNNHSEAIKDCERAIAIDPKYSKAYGRMGLALTSMNKYQEAINSYQKALDLDPENDSYKSNLKIAEQKSRDMSSPTGTGLSFDMASLINNPAFISMAASLMQNPQVQQLMSGMMTNAIGGPAAGVGGLTDLSSLIHAGQQFAQQIQQQNPELIEQLRNHVRSRSFSGSTEEHS
ncbi:small glutamine-rich tetratricopeptide repeat-containing protein beta [Crotalus tigris]|uniref:small glutamine-rich tetratricopeptide repeat-containing protein beta n=1 Tax=Crotalus tigris TaxID=88082 RepID=UPI00192F6B17|nr:small glutamine-rich tetratricopeptide repeat-containing protein beta [Crotalus tigris]